MKKQNKTIFEKEDLYLLIFTILFVLLYLQIELIVFIFLVPLLIYLTRVKKINFEKLFITFLIGVSINFSYFHEYGKKYLFAVIILYSIFLLLFTYLTSKVISKKYSILAIPSIYFLLFYILKFTIFNNFWMNLSGFLNIKPILIQYIGSYSTVFFIILINTLIFYLVTNYKSKNKTYISLFVITLILLGQIFLFPIKQISTENEILNVVGIQSNLNQSWTERIENRETNLNKYLSMSTDALYQYDVDVIVWQEYLFTHSLEFDISMQNRLHQFAIDNNITLILGSITLNDKKSMDSKRYNTLYIFENGNLQTYNAYEPFPLFDDHYVKSNSNPIITIQNNNIGFSLCYEENFPSVFTTQTIENDAESFFAVGNQYVMTNYRALKLTSLNSNLRAAENNRYVFRLETSGLSTAIDNRGVNLKEVPIKSEQILFYEIPLIKDKTFYSNHRVYVESLFVILSILILLARFKFFRTIKKSVKRK